MKTKSSLILLSFAFFSFLAAEDAPSSNQTLTEQNTQNSEVKKKKSPPRCSSQKGSRLYQEYSTAMHGRRYQTELSPSEWMTTMLFHRILVPFTAEDYCSLLDYFTDCDTGLNTEDTAQELSLAPISEKEPLACRLGRLPKSNFLVKGTAFSSIDALDHHNNTFLAGANPIFLWRYDTRILFEMELECGLEDKDLHIGMEYLNLNYIMNDYITIRGGKFLLPLGFWKEKMHPEWINKLPTPPLPYADEDHPVIPPSDLGLDIRGAVPVGTFGGALDVPMVLVYDFWVGNGPDQEEGDISLNGTNYNDNNNNKTIGARLAFRPWPYREFSISGIRGQWNDNGHGPDPLTTKHLYYNALVGSADLHFGDHFRFCGEFMWTKKDAPDGHDITTRAFWAQASTTALEMTDVKYIKNIELVLRYGLINTTDDDNKRQWSFGANYYLTSKMLFKFGFDLNSGHDNGDNRMSIQWAYGY